MIQKINDRLNEYLEFDNNQLYINDLIFLDELRDKKIDELFK